MVATMARYDPNTYHGPLDDDYSVWADRVRREARESYDPHTRPAADARNLPSAITTPPYAEFLADLCALTDGEARALIVTINERPTPAAFRMWQSAAPPLGVLRLTRHFFLSAHSLDGRGILFEAGDAIGLEALCQLRNYAGEVMRNQS